MKEKQAIFTVENFKFGVFDPVPKPDGDKAYILYKEGGDKEKILLITGQRPVMGGQIRAGGYNRIMKVSLEWRDFELRGEIADQTNCFHFYIKVWLRYRVNDPVYIFKNRIESLEGKIRNIVSNAIEEKHKKYDIESQIELGNDLKGEIREQFQKMFYLEADALSVTADLDQRAQNIIDSNLNAMADEVLKRNESERLSRNIEEGKKIKIQELEAEKDIQARKNALDMEKAEGVKALEEKLGEDYSTFLAYINGEISNVEFDERMHRNRNAAMAAKLQYFKELVEMDVLSGPALEKAAVRLLGDGSGERLMEDDSGRNQAGRQMLVYSSEKEKEIEVEDTEEY